METSSWHMVVLSQSVIEQVHSLLLSDLLLSQGHEGQG